MTMNNVEMQAYFPAEPLSVPLSQRLEGLQPGCVCVRCEEFLQITSLKGCRTVLLGLHRTSEFSLDEWLPKLTKIDENSLVTSRKLMKVVRYKMLGLNDSLLSLRVHLTTKSQRYMEAKNHVESLWWNHVGFVLFQKLGLRWEGLSRKAGLVALRQGSNLINLNPWNVITCDIYI